MATWAGPYNCTDCGREMDEAGTCTDCLAKGPVPEKLKKDLARPDRRKRK